jgi:ABC-type hemin transport system substrate-binding protein
MAQIGIRKLNAWLLAACIVIAAAGCDKSSPPAESASTAPAPPRAMADVRIVSLSPAITRTLADMALASRIVGRTPHCRSVKQSIPVVGDLVNVDYEQLVRLKPTHILVQPPATGIDQHLTDLATQQGWILHTWKLNNVDDIEQLVRDLPGVLFADGSPELADAARNSARILNDIAKAIAPGQRTTFQGRVMIVNSVDPVLAAGGGTYLNDILVAQGGVNAVTDRGWVQLSMEDVARIDPDAIIVVNSGDANGPQELLGPLWETQISAVMKRLLGAIRHPDAQLPSSAVVEIAAEMRRNLQVFEESSS